MELGGAFTIFLALCLSCLLILIAWKRMSKGGKLPPGPTPIPFLGNVLQVRTDATFQSFMKLKEKYGPVFTVYMGPRPVVILCGHEAVKEALVDRADEFSGRGELASIERNFQGHGARIEPTFFLSRTVSNVISSVVFGSRFDYEDKQFLKLLLSHPGEFPGDPAVRTPSFHSMGPGSIPGGGYKILKAQNDLRTHTCPMEAFSTQYDP